jgi:hypothetical protein
MKNSKYLQHWFAALICALMLVSALAVLPQKAEAIVGLEADIVPALAAPGSTFTFYGVGFKPEEKVSFWFNTPNGETYGNPIYVFVAADSGRVDGHWESPTDAVLGEWTLVLYGQESEVVRTARFTIGDPGVVPESETQPIAASASVVAPGEVIYFYATGFDDRETVGYWATAPNRSIEGNRAYQVLANRDGRADWSWRVPEAAPEGMWTMTAQGRDSKVKHTIRFEVRR